MIIVKYCPPHQFPLDALSSKIGNLGGPHDTILFYGVVLYGFVCSFLCTWNQSSFFLVLAGKISSAAPNLGTPNLI